MADREEWLKSLQDFGRGPDIAGDYAAHIKDLLSLRKYEMVSPRGRRTFFLSNDNKSNYSADIFQFPKSISETRTTCELVRACMVVTLRKRPKRAE
jgi:hypothetical protein